MLWVGVAVFLSLAASLVAIPSDTAIKPEEPSETAQLSLSSTATLEEPSGTAKLGLSSTAQARIQHIALLLRGGSFRDNTDDPSKGWGHDRTKLIGCCMESGRTAQMEGVQSVLNNFIKPMEAQGAVVDVFIQQNQCEGTSMNQDLIDAYKGYVRSTTFNALNSPQGQGIRTLLDCYDHWKLENPSWLHDQVYILRNDVKWLKPITEWKLNNNKINIASDCSSWSHGQPCYNDVFFMAPGYKYNLIDSAFGVHGKECFDPDEAPLENGHYGCPKVFGFESDQVQRAWDWSPAMTVVEDSPYMAWIPKRELNEEAKKGLEEMKAKGSNQAGGTAGSKGTAAQNAEANAEDSTHSTHLADIQVTDDHLADKAAAPTLFETDIPIDTKTVQTTVRKEPSSEVVSPPTSESLSPKTPALEAGSNVEGSTEHKAEDNAQHEAEARTPLAEIQPTEDSSYSTHLAADIQVIEDSTHLAEIQVIEDSTHLAEIQATEKYA